MKETNKKIIQTKRALRQALLSLIELKDIHEVTVSEVCREAKINRTTFYKYFSIPLDILVEYVDEICERVFISLGKNYDFTSESNLYEMMLEICRIYYDNKNIMKIYIECNKTLLPIVQQIFVKHNNMDLIENSKIYFISGGVTAIIFQWSVNDYKQLPEEIANVLTKHILGLYSVSRTIPTKP